MCNDSIIRCNEGTRDKEQACDATVNLPPCPSLLEDKVHSTDSSHYTMLLLEKNMSLSIYVLGNIKYLGCANEKIIFSTWTEFLLGDMFSY